MPEAGPSPGGAEKTEVEKHVERGIARQFRGFLKTYGVVALAIAFIIGQALNALVQAVVAGALMPLVAPLLPGEGWRQAQASFGEFGPFLYGEILYATIYFLVIALFVFLVAKYLLKQEQVKKL